MIKTRSSNWPEYEFWTRQLHLGRLHFHVTRNDWVASVCKERVLYLHRDRLGNEMAFITIRLGRYFFNIDWDLA